MGGAELPVTGGYAVIQVVHLPQIRVNAIDESRQIGLYGVRLS